MGFYDGFCALYGARDTLEPISFERGDRGIDESCTKLGEFGCDFVRCLLRDIVQSVACDDDNECKL